jgi:hypothetical protein
VIRGVLAGFVRVMLGVSLMALRDVGVVMRLLMVARGMMLRGHLVMLRGMLVVFGSLQVVLFAFFRHVE